MWLWLWLACGSGVVGPETGPPPPAASPVAPFEAAWRPDPEAPTRAWVSWSPRPGLVTVSWTDVAGERAVVADGALGEQAIVGLPAGSAVSWRVTVDGEEPISGQATVPAAPPALGAWATEGDPADPSWWLTTIFDFGEDGRSFAAVVDRQGRIRWWREAEPGHRILRARMSADGQAVLWASNLVDRALDEGWIVREPLAGGPAERVPAPGLHHDFVEHEGGYAYIGYVFRDVVVGDEVLSMASDAIRLVAPGEPPRDVFNFFDDWPEAPSIPCSHAEEGRRVDGYVEWTHSNSLVSALDGDGWWILPRYLDAIGRVAADGRLLGVVRGRQPRPDDRPLAIVPPVFAHPHFSTALSDTRLLLFDNGDHAVGMLDGSRVVEVELDVGAGAAEVVWEVAEPDRAVVGFLGDAVRLDGGETWIVNPLTGLFEVDDTGEVRWTARHQGPKNIGRVSAFAPWYR